MGKLINRTEIIPKIRIGILGWCVLVLTLFSVNSFAQSGCVGWYSTNSSGQVSYYNPVTAGYSVIGTFSSTNINAAAVQPSTGDVFFVNRATSKIVVYDVTNNTFATRSGTLPNLGTIVGAAFNNSGVLYVMYDQFKLITVDPSTGSQTGSTITYTGVPGDGGTPAGTNGDIVFDAAGQMWMVGDNSSTTRRLYRVSIAGTTATATAATPNITGLSGAIVGVAINPVTGVFYVITAGGTYSLNSTSGVATSVSAGTGNDLASCGNAPSAPTVSKSFSPATATAVPATSTLTLTFPNTNYTENFVAANIVDTLPSGMTIASPSGLGGTCRTTAGNTVTANAGSSTITFASGGRIPSGGCTITVNTTVSSFGTYTNTITSGSLRTIIGDYNVAALATFSVNQPADLTLTKSHSGSFTAGSSGNYSFSVNNTGGTPTSGTITLTDTLPAGLTVNGGAAGSVVDGGANSADWSCTSNSASPQVISCTSSTAIAASASSVLNFDVNVGLGTAIGTNSITNIASVSGGGETNTGNNSASDPTTILSPNLFIAKSHTGSFTRGGTGAYTLTVSNGGTAASSGTITVTDTLPIGLSVASGSLTLSGANAVNWGCNAAGQTITCTSSNAISVSGSSTFGFNVDVVANAASSVTNTASVSGGSEATANAGNNSTSDPTNTVLPPSFGCTDKGYGIKNAGTIAEFWEVNVATGASTQLLNPIIPSSMGGQGANSIGYNPLDGLIYGKRIGTNEIVRIASDLSVQIIPITGLSTANLFAADVDSNGIYYLTRTGYTTIERVDLNPSSPTYMTLLSPLTVSSINYSDIAINPNDGYGYAITDGAAPHSLLKINMTTGSITNLGTVTGGGSETVTTTFGGSWMDSTGNVYFNHGSTGNTYMVANTHSLSVGAVTSVFVSTSTTGLNDGARCSTSPLVLFPDLSLAKSHTGNFTVGSNGTYTFSVSNLGGGTSSGAISLTDILPSGLTVNGGSAGSVSLGGANAANWTCNSDAVSPQTVTCTSSTPIPSSGISIFSFSANVGSSTAVGTNSITNSASVSGGGESNTSNNSASDPTTVLAPDLTIDKSHSGNFTRGSSGTYSFTVSNSGTAASSGTITATDTLPLGLTVNGGASGSLTLGGANAANWGCNSNAASPQVITCTSSNAIAVGGSSTFNFSVNVALNTLGSVTNSVQIAGGGEAALGTGNNTDSDPTNVISPISCSNVYATAFSGGRTSLYVLNGSTMTAVFTSTQNVGGLAISSNGSAYYDDGTFTNPPLYRFDGSSQTNTGMFMPNLLVGQAADAAGNVYYIDGNYHLRKAPAGGSGNAQDLGALVFDAGDTIGPNMKYGDMIFDGNGRLYWYGSIANGAGKTYLYVIDPATLDAKDVGDIGPDGATGVAFDSNGRLITTSNAGATVISVDLGSTNLNGTTIGTASPTVYDMGGCSAPILNPNLTVAKSVSNITKSQTPATIAQSGDILEYTVIVTNNGNMPSYDATLADSIPTGTTYVAGSTTLNGTAYPDASGAMPFVTAREVNSTGQPSGVITAGGNTATLKFRVTVNASGLPANITNTATGTFPTVSGGVTTTNPVNSNTTVTPSSLNPPNINLVKSCPSPADCTTAPQMPGTDITYQIDFTNTGGQSAANMAIVDNIPGNMDYKIGSAAVSLGSTGLTFVIEYSSDYDPLNPTFATWTHTPVSAGGGAPAGYDRNVKAIRWRVTSGTLSNTSPNNTGNVSFVSKIR